ncbi:unnamed protein product [Ilex paraguariensis]|uniref:Uncharacterized protein n=1 Tax=Ilex paraguariensis TaxID=185542 RepID=A0ABC8R278_9AQUA
MEPNICDINHLDADVLLPPRKRLLAGLKKQSLDGNLHTNGNLHTPSTSSTPSEFDARLNSFLRFHLNNPNASNDEIVKASRLAAVEAVKVADAARASAEEKAVIAAKALAAAKSAMELVATVSEETGSKERIMKKNKMKKHVPVQLLYNKKKGIENCKTDEELARRLHQAMNSSPRISKNSSSSDLKGTKHKRLKSSSSEKIRVYNGGRAWKGKSPATANGNGAAGDVDSDVSTQDAYTVRVDENISKFNKANRLKMDNGQVGTNNVKDKSEEAMDDECSIGRKRGRIKQKKLPLSICSFRDQANPKEELNSRSSSLTQENTSKVATGDRSLFSVGPSEDGVIPVERTSMWKCQAFKAATCVKPNKVMQS